MVVKVQPVTPSLPATTTIQDPAARRFAQSVADILRTHQSTEYAVQQLTLAAEGLIGGGLPGTPPSIQEWLASSELYEKLRSVIERIDIEAKRAIIEEQEARVQAIADEAESRANEIALEIAARIAAVQAEADLRAQGLLAEAEARGAAIASEATVRQSEDESIAQSVTTLTSSVNNSLAGIEEELTTLSTNLGSEASERQTLAAQMRGSYTGNDLSGITTGLLYQERIARATADQGLAQQITLLSAGTGEQFDHFNIWYFDDGVEGWVGNGAPTVTGGWLRPANHATDPYVSSPAGLGAEGSTYSQVRVRVRKTGSPAWAGVLYWRGAADSTWDVARSASFQEPVFDANGIGLATVNLTWTGEIDRIRIDLSVAQTATDFFEIDWIAVGRPSPGASAAALLQEQIARASADAAEAASREALSVKLVGQADPDNLTLGTIASGLLYDEKLARSTADSTEVSKRESLSAKLTGFADPTGKTLVDLSSGLIYEEKTARATAVDAVALSVTALTTRVGNAEGAITEEQLTRSNADSTMASSITGLTAQFGGNVTYSVLKQFEFVSGVEGWVAGNATISNVGGSYLTMVATAPNPYISYTLPTADRYQGSLATKIRARIRRISGASVWEGRCYYTTAAHNASDSYRKVVAAPKDPATWTIVEWDMSALTNGGNDYATNEIRAIRLDLVSGAGDAWDIDWISIGEKVVSPASYDVQQVNAAITDEAKVRADADTATTSRINTMRSQLGVTEEGALVEGFILEERNTRASNDSAIVSAVNTALASITGVSNAISQSGENLIANWTSAQATKWSQIEAEVVGEGGNTIRAALAAEALVRSNADGSLGAQWTLKTDINGYISGFGFASTANNATPTSEFIIHADRFAVVAPGYGGYVPFSIGPGGAEFTGITNWSNVQGTGKPEDGATVGAALSTSDFSGGLSKWTASRGGAPTSVGSVVGTLINNDADFGTCGEFTFMDVIGENVLPKQVVTVTPGRVYKATATFKATTLPDGSAQYNVVVVPLSTSYSDAGAFVGVAASVTATNAVTTVSELFSTATLAGVKKLPTGTVYVRAGLRLNTTETSAPTVRVKSVLLEDVTDAWEAHVLADSAKDTADLAKNSADAAAAKLADIAADNKLTPVEKKAVRAEWDTIYAERAGIRAQADLFTIITEKTAYDNAFQALGTYLNGGTAYTIGSTRPLWIKDATNLALTTTVVGDTFRSTWATLYQRRQELLNAVSAKAKQLADSANSALADIASDSKLTSSEKKVLRTEWNAAYSERAALRSQADSFGVTTEKTTYDSAFQALGTYLNGGTAYTIGSTPPSWITDANLNSTTAVVGTTLRSNWTTFYTARQGLLNALTAKAKTLADTANNALADIAADNKLAPAEKKSVRKEWDAIYAERAGIRAQADSFGITTEKTNYDNDFQALGTYLNGGTTYTIGTTPPSWITDANLAVTTSITGATFRNYWKNLYADRQALLNKISAEAAKRADWALTNGKPDDEDILNAGHPLNKNPDLQGAVANAETAPGWQRVFSNPAPAFAGIRVEAAGSSYGPPWDREAPMFYATIADTANAANEQAYWVSEGFTIDISKPHCLSGWARKMWSNGTPKVYFRVRCYDKDGVSLGHITHYSAYTGLTTTWEQMVKKIEPADWPVGTYKVRIEWYGAYQQYGSSVATRLMLNEGRVPTKNLAPPVVDIDAHLTRNGTSVLADDFVATWNKINSSNILVYMGPTAITEAVIGTAAISTAKIKDGAITTAKIGDAQISSANIADAAITNAKIGTASVDTLQLANNAVTVSSYAIGGSTTAPISTTLNIPANQTLRIVAIGFLPGRSGYAPGTSHTATVSINTSALTETAYGGVYNVEEPGDSSQTLAAVSPMTIVHTLNVSGGTSGTTATISIESSNLGTKRIVAFGMLK